MGIAYGFHSLWKKAKKYFKKSMMIRQDMPDFDKDALFSSYYHLGHAYIHLNKDEKAIEYLELAMNDQVEAAEKVNSYSWRLVSTPLEALLRYLTYKGPALSSTRLVM